MLQTKNINLPKNDHPNKFFLFSPSARKPHARAETSWDITATHDEETNTAPFYQVLREIKQLVLLDLFNEPDLKECSNS